MDIRALRYFVELVREKSFTRASEKLFVTQPTISKMIRNIEEELGQPLLNREGRRFTLTDSGQVLFNRAQTILAEMQQLEAELACTLFIVNLFVNLRGVSVVGLMADTDHHTPSLRRVLRR